MHFTLWLAMLAAVFVLAERIWPRERRPFWRKGLLTDVAFLVINAEFAGTLVAVVLANTFGFLRMHMTGPWAGFPYIGTAWRWPVWVQIPVLLVASDFIQYFVHRSLHRYPALWRFHQVHHSIEQLDWIGNWRFHWFEVLYYQAVLYVPMALFGFSGTAFLAQGVVAVAVGHFAHSNLRWNLGALRYVVNSPQMHWWHHNHPDEGPMHRNFAITLAAWDWLFGTANLPDHDPRRLGFEGIEGYPTSNLLKMYVKPFQR